MAYPMRMFHEKHGFDHAYGPLQEQQMRSHGWREEFEPPADEGETAVASSSPAPEAVGGSPEPKRRGRPPKVRA